MVENRVTSARPRELAHSNLPLEEHREPKRKRKNQQLTDVIEAVHLGPTVPIIESHIEIPDAVLLKPERLAAESSSRVESANALNPTLGRERRRTSTEVSSEKRMSQSPHRALSEGWCVIEDLSARNSKDHTMVMMTGALGVQKTSPCRTEDSVDSVNTAWRKDHAKLWQIESSELPNANQPALRRRRSKASKQVAEPQSDATDAPILQVEASGSKDASGISRRGLGSTPPLTQHKISIVIKGKENKA